MKSEDRTIIGITVNNNNELNFKFDIDALMSLESVESMYMIIASLEKMKANLINVLNEVEKEIHKNDNLKDENEFPDLN